MFKIIFIYAVYLEQGWISKESLLIVVPLGCGVREGPFQYMLSKSTRQKEEKV